MTSRKFWCAVIGFITAVLTAFNVADLTIEQVVAIITACSTLIAYIIGEGLVDSARIKNTENEIILLLDSETLEDAVKTDDGGE